MDDRRLELAGFQVVLGGEQRKRRGEQQSWDDEQQNWDHAQRNWDDALEWGEAVNWGKGTCSWWGAEEYPVAPCRTIEVTEEIRAADARQRAEREAQRRASITWVSPVAARKGMELVEREPKRPAVYLFPSARVRSNRREVA